jgi:coatomer subunit beta
MVADMVINVLLEFLTDDAQNQVDVVAFVKEVMERFPALRENILRNLLESFPDVKSEATLRGVLWVVGEYSDSVDMIQYAMEQISMSVGKISIEEDEEEQVFTPTKVAHAAQKRVLADGTYATETSYSAPKEIVQIGSRHPIKSIIFLISSYFCW